MIPWGLFCFLVSCFTFRFPLSFPLSRIKTPFPPAGGHHKRTPLGETKLNSPQHQTTPKKTNTADNHPDKQQEPRKGPKDQPLPPETLGRKRNIRRSSSHPEQYINSPRSPHNPPTLKTNSPCLFNTIHTTPKLINRTKQRRQRPLQVLRTKTINRRKRPSQRPQHIQVLALLTTTPTTTPRQTKSQQPTKQRLITSIKPSRRQTLQKLTNTKPLNNSTTNQLLNPNTL